MSVGPVGASSASSIVLEQSPQAHGTQKLNEGKSDGVETAPAGSVAVQVSPVASFLLQVTALQQVADPEKLKAALAQASKELKLAAQQSPGPEAQLFSKLADRFAAAARTGDLVQLQPEKPGSAAQPTGLAAYQSLSATESAVALRGPGSAAGQNADYQNRRNGSRAIAESGTFAALSRILGELRDAVRPLPMGPP
jgi:hypothetical protein